jgi:hypothetical protein
VRTRFRLHATMLAVVALGALLLIPSVAAADHKGKKTLRLVAVEKQFEFIDVGAEGPSVGDYFAFSDLLFFRGREVGESGGECKVTQAMPPYDVLTYHCVATLNTRRGQITLQGLIEIQGEDDPGPFRFAITGGTRQFRCACGEATVRFRSDERSTIRLRFENKCKDRGKDKDRGKGKNKPR